MTTLLVFAPIASAGLADMRSSASTFDAGNWTPARVGKAIHGTCVRYTSGFKCSVNGHRLWVKPAANGNLCSSRIALGLIRPACLTGKSTLEGTATDASEAMGVAIAKRFDPNAHVHWQVALPHCQAAGASWACQVKDPLLTATATVTWRNGAPVTVFQSFVCGGVNVGRPGCE